MLGCLLDSSSWEKGQEAGSFEHGNIISEFVKYGVFLDYLPDYWLAIKG
jgi:hypothetical protein